MNRAEYMREYRKKNPPLPKNNIRICPDCKSRELEYHKKLCSECAEINDRMSKDIAQNKWLKNGGKDYHKNYWRMSRDDLSKTIMV